MRLKRLFTIASLIALGLSLVWANHRLDPYMVRILNLCAINIILATSLNLIFGFAGQFSLGHAGFMAVGAYACALLTMTPAQKEATFIISPLIRPLATIQLPFLPAILIGGILAAIFGFIIGAPTLRLRGDYLAIASLGFAEIIRVVGNNAIPITNGALGLKGIPEYTNLYWSWGAAAITIFIIKRLVDSSYGRAMMAVRENEIAAEVMGVSLFYHKVLAFVIGSFFAGVGGALLANLVTTIDPKTFIFILTFNILIIVVIGGLASITGSCLAAIGYTILLEALRPLEAPMTIGPVHIPGVPGLRMVIFSLVLLAVILFYRQGLMGKREFGWGWLVRRMVRKT
ncbi:ABC transporter permease [candidate division TA06 bacterium DG_24]|uniref:ABC transporter permease n=3 Tax=Bacteria division TA06 TaxID=1156500 RepID=A0A0S8JM03_UNCT6|nr:MAG: ABC transporter permease [candidate division TA06 bacterium DG_24]KPK68879.1 MAG: ABC transporter permease [candidate division TA06 bacterium SM23_40]KPL09789.1 MAG: ABC transporter permease [candidate division TA06 bacterium SM1_40]